MKTSLIVAAMVMASMSATYSQGEALSLQSRSQLRQYRLENKSVNPSLEVMRKASPMSPGDRKVTVAFLLLADGTTTEQLEAEGMRVLTMRSNIAVVEIGYDDVERCGALPMVKSLQLQRGLKPHMDKARPAAGVDMIHSGQGEVSQPYTGAGVVTALVDQGVDPNHINFVDEDGNSRIGFLSHLRYNNAGTAVAENFYGANVLDAPAISKFTTDDKTTYHGTHTLGILAGGYKGEVEMMQGDGVGRATSVTAPNPYYGVATGSDIAVSCGVMSDGFIMLGMDYMLNYANFLEEPAVFSLSLGSNTGPHDPNSVIAQFFDMLGELSIICVSSGNEGDTKIALSKTLTAEDNAVKTLIHPYLYQFDPAGEETFENNTIRYGAIAIYSDDATPFDLQAVIYNKSRDYKVAKRMPKIGDGVGTYYCSSTDYQLDDTDIVGDATFCKAFEGYVGVGGMIDEETGRYYGMIDYYVIDSEENRENPTYVLGFEVTGTEGQRIDCYGDGMTTWMDNYGMDAFDDGSCNGSLSDMAVAKNIIVVGSYNTCDRYYTLDGELSGYFDEGFQPGMVSGFSSYGTLVDGRNLPTVCAPGSTIVSSMSAPFLNAVTEGVSDETSMAYRESMCSARVTDASGKTHYWKQEVGTSMACPFVAGCIATWLEADPTLTVDEVREIIRQTATVDDNVLAGDPVKWGAGKFNALEGLKEVIRRSGAGITDVVADNHNDKVIVTESAPNLFNIFCGDSSGALDITVYAVTGTEVAAFAVNGDEATLDATSWPKGVYVVNVNSRHSVKIYVH